MGYTQIILFIILSTLGILAFAKNIRKIFYVIQLGKPTPSELPFWQRIKHILVFALGQKKMFDNPLVALLHLVIYASFIIINIELIEIIIDGLTANHRSALALLPDTLYAVIMNVYEILAALVILACIIFLCRRNWLKLKRLIHKDLNGFPKRDGNLILIIEIVLMFLFIAMNASEYALQNNSILMHETNILPNGIWLSSYFAKLLSSWNSSSLTFLFYISWWLHYVGILLFLNYLPFSKHLHILLGFVNIYKYNAHPKGRMSPMPSIQKEVKAMLENTPSSEATIDMGAKDIFQLEQKSLLDAFSCTECGRCSMSCPAFLSGKLLSPRKIMMSVRDRSEDWMRKQNKENTLLHNYISQEELQACTSCQACIEACPVMIDPMSIILQMRRALIMEEAQAPKEWNEMFSNIENNFSPWKYNSSERGKALID